MGVPQQMHLQNFDKIVCDCSAIDPEEKIGIKRTLLLESFAEPVPQIAIQMAVLIGNISRLDYPNDWDDVSHVVTLLHLRLGSTNRFLCACYS